MTDMARAGGVKQLGQPIGLVVGIITWVLGTLWLGSAACWRCVRLARRLPLVFSKTLRCPRGHAVPAYGVFACGGCRARFEGYAFSPCPSCGGLTTFITCTQCGLSVQDPLR